MKLLFVTKVRLDQPFGGARHVLAVCRELISLGHEVTLAAPGREAPIDGLARIRPPAGVQPGLRMESILAAQLAVEIARRRPHVVYLRLSPTSSLIPAVVRALGVPLALELNGPILDELRASGRSDAAIRTVERVLRPTVRHARALIAASENVARHARTALGARDPIVVWNGADLDVATPGDRGEARRALGLDPEQRYLAFAGTLVEEQRIDLLCAAHRRLPGVGLLVAGGGPRAAEVEAHARSAPPGSPVQFLGALPHDAAICVLRAADVCVSTRSGDLGMKPLEYAAVGRRFVLFEEDGIDRLLGLYPGEEAVFAVKEKSEAALLSALEAALDAEARRGPLPAPAIERARAEIGWDRTAARIAEVLAAHLS